MNTIPAKTIISGYTESGWFGSNYNMNIYKGCCHGCIYCDSRSECYRIENFDMVQVKENALAVIERDLKSKRKKGTVITGSMSDSYNPFEEKYMITRGALKLFDQYGFGVCIDTKSSLVLRDIDVLIKIKEHSSAIVNFTITAYDDELCNKIEPNVCPSSERFMAIKKLSDAGIMCGVLLMPVLPFINDTKENILEIVRKSKESGAKWIYPGGSFGVTLRNNQRDYFFEKLDAMFPGIKVKYIRAFNNSYICNSFSNNMLWEKFTSECEEYGLLYCMDDIIGEVRKGYEKKQISMFDMINLT